MSSAFGIEGTPRNRAERRKFYKDHPEYRKMLKNSTKTAFDNLQQAFESQWAAAAANDDEGKGEKDDDGEDENLNY